jgi:hypothetical protein
LKRLISSNAGLAVVAQPLLHLICLLEDVSIELLIVFWIMAHLIPLSIPIAQQVGCQTGPVCFVELACIDQIDDNVHDMDGGALQAHSVEICVSLDYLKVVMLSGNENDLVVDFENQLDDVEDSVLCQQLPHVPIVVSQPG